MYQGFLGRLRKGCVVSVLLLHCQFSEAGCTADQKSSRPAQPSLPGLPQAATSLFRMLDPHGWYRIHRRRMSGIECCMNSAGNVFGSFSTKNPYVHTRIESLLNVVHVFRQKQIHKINPRSQFY
jgi:hypothetical protein